MISFSRKNFIFTVMVLFMVSLKLNASQNNFEKKRVTKTHLTLCIPWKLSKIGIGFCTTSISAYFFHKTFSTTTIDKTMSCIIFSPSFLAGLLTINDGAHELIQLLKDYKTSQKNYV